jgi:glutathione reductase (NADPH)
MHERKSDLTRNIPIAMQNLTARRGTVFNGRGKFVGDNAIEVNGQTITGDNIVIATGSKTRPLPLPGAEFLITSDDVLSDTEQPSEVVFIGGGVIAMEFSHVYSRAGTKVTILEGLPRILPRLDADAVAVLRAESERLGITIATNVTVKKVTKDGGRFSVHYEHDGKQCSVLADRAINGAGRVPNISELALEIGNVSHEGLSVAVDGYLRSTSNPSVWVCGDVLTGSAQLSPLATYEGQVVGRNLVHGANEKPDYAVVPSAIYTVPALSMVGITEDEAVAKNLDVRVAWSKTIIHNNTDRLVGAHIIGHQGEELIHLFALAMRHGITAGELKKDLYAFPTFSADVKSLL